MSGIPKIKVDPSRVKAKVDFKLGDHMNAELQGYGKTPNIVKGKNILGGSKVFGKLKYEKGRHSIIGTGDYSPDSNESNVGIEYKLKF